ncbi:hypothetical protein A3C57_00860 [Candidatus Nomurabacteria bacterium RIFCSPHIGHO2_02_FULL_33_12]|uniref:DUF86 domain-containing protein n=1 Tax=Candidatus Nomurabacteria bacterium RIFCSPLOWO2_01_FULL_33_17 TaxID=1801764 RepID=A0A1F6WMT7_9BACT|nr:MAG: hypothetical protein A3C57_00860 [Candidatus Nomurabacteria bacterium RIFCSPHIGHO2_02_FULL_33_12]OGI83193.1 MAG: hypothetical protein A2903_02690 [Candidatus Nomurabacteria bacterium RIFCSPLOWO2_01_FULL_33_17]
MIDKEIVQAKLNIMHDNMILIKDILSKSNEELKVLDIERSAMERCFQLIVDAAVGINEHIISEENLKIPNDYYGTFLILGSSDILPREFADKIAPSVGLRNRLVHQYEKIDISRMILDIRQNINDYDKYMAIISDFVE